MTNGRNFLFPVHIFLGKMFLGPENFWSGGGGGVFWVTFGRLWKRPMTGENFGTIRLAVQKLSSRNRGGGRRTKIKNKFWPNHNLIIIVMLIEYVCGRLIYYITEQSVRWYCGFSIATTSARRPWRDSHSNLKNIQRISFKFYMRVDTPLRYVAIEIWYPLRTSTTAFAAKWQSYPPNLRYAISPYK